MEALLQQHDPETVRFFACDFWQGTAAQCDLYRDVSGITFPVLMQAHVLGSAAMYDCSYHYAIVIDGDGLVQYRGSVNIPALAIVLAAAVERLDGGTSSEGRSWSRIKQLYR